MCALEKSREWPIKVTEVLLAMWAADFLCADYRFKGICLIGIYYFLRKSVWGKHAAGAVWNLIWNGSVQMYGAAATAFLIFYNGEKGASMKYFFYLFYPLHLLALYGIHHLAL